MSDSDRNELAALASSDSDAAVVGAAPQQSSHLQVARAVKKALRQRREKQLQQQPEESIGPDFGSSFSVNASDKGNTHTSKKIDGVRFERRGGRGERDDMRDHGKTWKQLRRIRRWGLWRNVKQRAVAERENVQASCPHKCTRLSIKTKSKRDETEQQISVALAPPTLEEPICNGDADAEDGDEGEDDELPPPLPCTTQTLHVMTTISWVKFAWMP